MDNGEKRNVKNEQKILKIITLTHYILFSWFIGRLDKTEQKYLEK